MARLRYNGLASSLASSATAGATSLTLATALTHSGGTAVPTIATDRLPLAILDSTGALLEIVHATAYTSGSTTVTVARAQEGTAAVSLPSGAKVIHGPTVTDFVVATGTAQPDATTVAPFYLQTG